MQLTLGETASQAVVLAVDRLAIDSTLSGTITCHSIRISKEDKKDLSIPFVKLRHSLEMCEKSEVTRKAKSFLL